MSKGGEEERGIYGTDLCETSEVFFSSCHFVVCGLFGLPASVSCDSRVGADYGSADRNKVGTTHTMSRLEEVVISTSIGKSADGDEGGIRVWSPSSGQQYACFSGNSSGKGSLAFVPSRRRQALPSAKSDYIVTAQMQKPLIKYWQWGREDVHMRCATPEKMCVVCLTPGAGSYIISGGVSGRLYIWGTVTGKLHRVWEGHYRNISAIAVSPDGSMVVSASDDATVQLWSLADILDRSVPAAALHGVKPRQVWKGHSLPVSAICISGHGAATGLRVLSCSTDQTLKVWDANSSKASVTFACPDVLHSMALDPHERFVFVGGGSGDIFQANLELSGSLADWLKRDSKPQQRFRGHEAAVTCLAVSMGGLKLVSGSVDKTLKVWDVATLQILQTFRGHDQHGPVSAVRVILRPKELFAKEKVDNLVPLGRLSNFVSDEHEARTTVDTIASIRVRAQLPEVDIGGANSSGSNSNSDILTASTTAEDGGGRTQRRKRPRSHVALSVDPTTVKGAAISSQSDQGSDKQARLEAVHESEIQRLEAEKAEILAQNEQLKELNSQLDSMLRNALRADR